MDWRFTLALPLLLAVGCATDPDADGLTNKEEAELLLDPDNPDTDADGLTDGDEVLVYNTNPLNPDTDEDGLIDGDELAESCDPLNPDTDGDSFLDGTEVSEGSDPLVKFDWPFRGGIWPDFSADAPAGFENNVEVGLGLPLPNINFRDQSGNRVDLMQFYGMVVLVDFSAGWCGPCQAVAENAQEMWRSHRKDGFIILHAMIDGWGSPSDADKTFRNEWADQFGLKFPVGGGGNIEDVLGGLGQAGIYQNAIPFVVVLNRELELALPVTGSGQDATIEATIESLLRE